MLAITNPPHHTVSHICRPRQPSQVRNAPATRPMTALRTMKSSVAPQAESAGSSPIRYRMRAIVTRSRRSRKVRAMSAAVRDDGLRWRQAVPGAGPSMR